MSLREPSRSLDERGTFDLGDEAAMANVLPEEEKAEQAKTVSTVAFHPSQQEFFNALRSEEYLYMLFGGAVQGGKTTLGLFALFMLCKLFPGSRWAVVRKDGPTIKRNLLPLFNKWRPPGFIGPVVGAGSASATAHCANGSEIIFFPESLDTDPEHNRWRGLLVNGFLLEEANELAESTFVKAQERAGTWKVPGKRQPMPYILLTCNPSRNWIYTRFYLPWKQERLEKPYYFQRALPDDNPHLTAQYRESLKNLPPQAYKRFVEGDWDVLDEPDQLINYEWLLKAQKDVPHVSGKNYLGVDVARYGDDDSCLARRNGNGLIGIERHHGLSTVQLGERVCAAITGWPVAPGDVRIDVIGLGAGTVDYCHSQRHQVIGFNVSEKAPLDNRYKNFKFKNKRSWAGWHLREAFRQGQIHISPTLETSRLFQDLAAWKYRISGDKVVEIESKDELKKRLGRSPDCGDAVIAAYADDPNLVTRMVLGAGAQKSGWKF